MTYKLFTRHKDFTAEWEKLPSTIRDQFKKKLAKVIEQPHIPKNILRGDLAGCYKIKLLKAGVRLVYQVKDDQVVILLITVGSKRPLNPMPIFNFGRISSGVAVILLFGSLYVSATFSAHH
jgi:mRNA interferase RelE/StbE